MAEVFLLSRIYAFLSLSLGSKRLIFYLRCISSTNIFSGKVFQSTLSQGTLTGKEKKWNCMLAWSIVNSR